MEIRYIEDLLEKENILAECEAHQQPVDYTTFEGYIKPWFNDKFFDAAYSQYSGDNSVYYMSDYSEKAYKFQCATNRYAFYAPKSAFYHKN